MDEADSASPRQPRPQKIKKIRRSSVSVSAAAERAMKARAEWRANKAKKGKTNSMDQVYVLFGGFCSLMCGTKGHSRAADCPVFLTHRSLWTKSLEIFGHTCVFFILTTFYSADTNQRHWIFDQDLRFVWWKYMFYMKVTKIFFLLKLFFFFDYCSICVKS